MATKPKIGRPPIEPAAIKRNRNFRASDQDWQDWTDRASKLGVAITDIIVAGTVRELARLERRKK